MREVLVLLPDSDERRTLVRRKPAGLSIRLCTSPEQISGALGPLTEAVVCAPCFRLGRQPRILEAIDASGVKLIVRGQITHSSSVEIAALANLFPHFRLCLFDEPDKHDPGLAILQAMSEIDGGPIGTVVAQIEGIVPTEGFRFLIAALWLGKTRVDVTAYCRSLNLSRRSVEVALQAVNLPSPHRLLLWGQACWMVWRMNRYGWGSKQVAAVGGFRDSASMAIALTPIAGKSPRLLAQIEASSSLATLWVSAFGLSPLANI